LIAVSGCATDYDRRYAAAERLQAEAAAAGAEWLETGKLLDQANKEADGGNMDAAFSLLDKARSNRRSMKLTRGSTVSFDKAT